MTKILPSKRWLWLCLAIPAILLVSGYAYHRHFVSKDALTSRDRLISYVLFEFPLSVQIVEYQRKGGPFESSQAWLLKFPLSESRPWESSPHFHECEPGPNHDSDYLAIRETVHKEFPKMEGQFQKPRIWRGGLKGNCYIASSDDGAVTFVYYFTS